MTFAGAIITGPVRLPCPVGRGSDGLGMRRATLGLRSFSPRPETSFAGRKCVPQWIWPEGLVELVNWGCHYFSGIDCLHPSCPVFFYNHDFAVGDATLADCLSREADSLNEWLSAWLDGANLWERGKQRGGNVNSGQFPVGSACPLLPSIP